MADRYEDGRHDVRDPAPDAPRPVEGGGAAPQGDPLAELAKLIGQTDPFANFGRANPTHPLRRDNGNRTNDAGRTAEETDPYFDREIFDEAPPPPAWIQHRNEMLTGLEQQEQDDLSNRPHPLRRFTPNEGDPAVADAQYADGQYQDAHYGDDAPFPRPPAYPNDAYAYGDDYADNPTAGRERSRRGVLTVAAVFGLAVIGTGGAFAYRTYVAGPKTAAEVPVIKADPNPIKVVPPTSAEAANKAIQDRIGSGAGENLVPREEQPVDVRDPTKAAARPAATLASKAPSSGTVPTPPSSLTVPGEEPRRVRTFTVKGDQSESSNAKPAPRAATPTPAPAPAKQQAAPGPVANLAPQTSSAPLSLNPRANLPAPTTPAQTSGGYVVQVSSQRSESDAQASYRSLQSKFPSVLGSRSASIKRADLGEKGVYYRAVLGPFGSAEDAAALCGNLKSAGGQCVVQRN